VNVLARASLELVVNTFCTVWLTIGATTSVLQTSSALKAGSPTDTFFLHSGRLQ